MTPQGQLYAAADWLETHEWLQHSGFNYEIIDRARKDAGLENGSFYAFTKTFPGACACGLGAVWAVNGGRDYEASNLFKAKHGVYIAKFNDAPGRTKAEVIAAMREAACSE